MPFGDEVPGSAADYQADDDLRRVQHGSGSRRQFFEAVSNHLRDLSFLKKGRDSLPFCLHLYGVLGEKELPHSVRNDLLQKCVSTRSHAGEKNRSKDRPLEKRTPPASGGRYKHQNEAKKRRASF